MRFIRLLPTAIALIAAEYTSDEKKINNPNNPLDVLSIVIQYHKILLITMMIFFLFYSKNV